MIEINIFNKALNLKIEDSKVRELVHLTLNEIHYEKISGGLETRMRNVLRGIRTERSRGVGAAAPLPR